MSNIESGAEISDPGRNCALGVHLAIDSLRVVEVVRGRITRWLSVPYPPGLHPGAAEFPAFLKERLAEFFTVLRHTAIWVVGPAPSLQVRFLSLPKVRPRQVSNLAYWTFRKEIPFDAAQTVFDYDLEGGDPSIAGSAKKIDVTAYTVAQPEVDALVGLFGQAGIRVDGILLPFFAMRNLFRNQPSGGRTETAMGLYVGEDSSSIMFLKGKTVVSHRLFKTGLNVVLDVVRDRHPEWTPAKAYHVIRAAIGAVPFGESTPEPLGAAEIDQIREAVRAAFGRLIQQVERSMSAYLVGREEGIKDIYVAGSMAGLTPLVDELGSRLGVKSLPMDLFQAFRFADKTSSPWRPEEAGMMAIALGAALSDKSLTPNLIYTYVKRQKEASGLRAKKLLVGLGAVAVALMLSISHLVSRANDRMQEELKDSMAKIQRYSPRADRAMIQSLSDRAAAESAQMKRMARRSLPIAALNQLARLTPEDIRLVSAKWEPGEAAGAANRAKKKPSTAAGTDPEIRLLIEGMVLGEIGAQESKLASYQLRLEDSEMFEDVFLLRSEGGTESGEPVLLVGLDMQMEKLAGAPAAAPPPPPEKGREP